MAEFHYSFKQELLLIKITKYIKINIYFLKSFN